MASVPASSDVFLLSASYTSPSNEPFTVSENINPPSSSGTEDKTKYLSGLRKAVSSAQERLNKELTARMDQDKAKEAGEGDKSVTGADDAKEEENYGEEVPEDED